MGKLREDGCSGVEAAGLQASVVGIERGTERPLFRHHVNRKPVLLSKGKALCSGPLHRTEHLAFLVGVGELLELAL